MIGSPRQQLRFCRAHDGARLAYATSGDGPPLVKAANWISHLECDLQSPVWGHLVDELSSRHRLVRYDQRGCGLSDRDAGGHGLETWVDDLERVVEAAGLSQFPLLGISQGAAVAVAYAVRHPRRVTHLVLHGGFARGRLRRAATPAMREEAACMPRLAEIGWGRDDDAWRQFFTTRFIPRGRPEQQRWFNELQRVSATPATAAAVLRAADAVDIVDLLPKVRCPTLVLHATGDARIPFDQGRLLASAIPGARLAAVESCNHLLLPDEPGWGCWVEEFRSFLPGAAPRAKALGGLTPRELALLGLIATGRDNAQIAATLALCEKTVRNHVTSIYCSVLFCLELKCELARITFCRMSRALLVQMNGLGSLL